MVDSTGRRTASQSSKMGRGARDLMHVLPLPLAQLVRRALNGKSAEERHHEAFYLAECTLKLAAAGRVGLWMDRALSPGSDLARKLEALVLPSLGHWCEFLRELTTALAKRPDVALLPPLCDLSSLTRKRPDWAAVDAFARRGVELGILGDEATKQALRRGALGFFDLLVAYRNEVIGHGAQRTTALYDELAGLLFDATVEVLGERALFGGLELGQARLEVSGNVSRTAWYALAGLAGLAREGDAGDAIAGQLYLFGPGVRVPLHPLVVYRQEDELGREQVGFLNRTARKRGGGEGGVDMVRSADYLDYASGQSLEGVDARAALTTLLARLKGRPVTARDLDAAASATRAEMPEAAQDDTVAEGAVIGDFELLGELGRGAMGVVYKARQRSLGRIVALKVLPPALAADPVAQKRFKKEMLALARCDHPNVVRILATGSDGAHDYYAMEYVDGADLTHADALLSRWKQEKAPAPARKGSAADRLAGLFADAADGLEHLHKNGVIHRDLKPGNLMLTADGKRLVIMDLGLAKLADESQALTSVDVNILGTLRYMAPEQLQRRLVDVDARADVYGLGATLYELATGRRIHDGETEQRLIQQVLNEEPMPPQRADPTLREDLATVISTAVAKLPARRYPTAKAFADDLRAVALDQPIKARPPSFAQKAARWVRQSRAVLAGFGVALALGLVVAAVAWDRTRFKVTYFADYVDRRGIPEGVGELRGPEGRNVTYKLTRRGGRVVRLESVNGRGFAVMFGAFSSMELSYTEDGKLASYVERGPTGKFISKHVCAYKESSLQVQRQDRNDLPEPERGDLATYRYEYDTQGFRRKVTYYNDRGSPRPSFGVYGYEQTSDARGLPATYVFIDADGRPAVRTDGVAKATVRRDAEGHDVGRDYFGADDKPVQNAAGVAGLRDAFDAHGNVIEHVTVGVDGRPLVQKDGTALWRARYDDQGCLIEKSFFDADGKPTVNKQGFAMTRSRCDEHGREAERAHLDTSAAPVVTHEGYATYRVRYDERGNEVERAFFGVDGKPVRNIDGAAIVRTTFDDGGNAAEVASFDEGGRPTLVKEGYATVRYRHDDRDHETEVAYFGVSAERVVARDGCALWRAKFDDRGKEVERDCLGVDERPRASAEGWAVVRSKVDERGNVAERSYFDVAGGPVAAPAPSVAAPPR